MEKNYVEMYEQIKNEMKGNENYLASLVVKQQDYEKKLEQISKEITKTKDAQEALKMVRDGLELYTMSLDDDIVGVKPAVKEEEKKKETVKTEEATPEKKKITRNKGRVVMYDRNGNETGNYSSQGAAARAIHWDQSGLSKFMRLDRETQIRTKNCYFMWA